MIKEWHVYEPVPNLDSFTARISASPIVASVLWHRGIRTKKDAMDFLYPERVSFGDPFLMRDMDLAVSRIIEAIDRRERIVVYGDYDVDGISATAVLLHNLRKLGANADFYIPNRMTEGYGLNRNALEMLAPNSDLLISVDCGIASVKDVEAMKEKLDIIITDHHLPGNELPPAVAVLNPHRKDCPYPEKDLCGAGVAFKLCQALWHRMERKSFEEDLELVALGTVADLVPLRGENRRIVKEGLMRMTDTAFIGLDALIEIAGLKGKPINAGHVGFILAPRLNAAGRIGTARKGVSLLLATEKCEARSLALELDLLNTERQTMEHAILEDAEERLVGKNPQDMPAIVVAGKDWNPGVIGIVASRLVDRYYKPTIVLSIQSDGICKGSCRSIKGLHMYKALNACRANLIQFGGHEMAAGLSVKETNLSAFDGAFQDYARQHLSLEDYIPKVAVEAELPPEEITIHFIEELARMEPYGMGNPKPLFGCRQAQIHAPVAIGKEGAHLRFQLGEEGKWVTGLFWNEGKLAPVLETERMELVYVPAINEWNGKRTVQCMIDSMQVAREDRQFPSREILRNVYRFLRTLYRMYERVPYDDIRLTLEYRKTFEPISYYTMECSLTVFQELGILACKRGEQGYEMPAVLGKIDLMKSSAYRREWENGTIGD